MAKTYKMKSCKKCGEEYYNYLDAMECDCKDDTNKNGSKK